MIPKRRQQPLFRQLPGDRIKPGTKNHDIVGGLERYDIFMNNYTECTWTMVAISQAIKDLMKTYVKYPPRKTQSMSYDSPIEISKYEKFQWIREALEKEGVNIPMPAGN